MFIYLAHPIDQVDGTTSWFGTLVHDLIAKLVLADVGAFRPGQAYACRPGNEQHATYVDGLNGMALFAADAILAIAPSGVPTLGVPAEIETALHLNKPTVIVTDIVGSVQMHQWKSRGATVIDLSTEGLPDWADLRKMLTILPDPEGSEPDGSTMVVKYDKGALPLTKAHPTDAGFDVATLDNALLLGGVRAVLRTGIRAMVPEGWYGRLTGRSSALARWNIEVHEGVIDAGYTGELKIAVTYRGAEGSSVEIPAGTRLAQYVLGPVWDGDLVIVDEMPTTLRGEKGWGSSGV